VEGALKLQPGMKPNLANCKSPIRISGLEVPWRFGNTRDKSGAVSKYSLLWGCRINLLIRSCGPVEIVEVNINISAVQATQLNKYINFSEPENTNKSWKWNNLCSSYMVASLVLAGAADLHWSPRASGSITYGQCRSGSGSVTRLFRVKDPDPY